MRYNLAGLSIASTACPIETYDQLRGTGTVRNKALAIPGHLNGQEGGPWASVEYVSIDPVTNGEASSVGRHTQTTDEIYYVLEGAGTLTTNWTPAEVSAGNLALAPRGTTHTICNNSPKEALSFLVVELHAPGPKILPPALLDLPEQMHTADTFYPVRVGQQLVHPRMTTLDFRGCFSGPWGLLTLVELPPGARVDEYTEACADQLLLLSQFTSVVVKKRGKTEPGEVEEEIRVNTTGEGYQCIVVPRGVPRRIVNRASGNHPALLLCLNVLRG